MTGIILLPGTGEINAYAFKFFFRGQWYGDWVKTDRQLTRQEEIAAKETMLDLAQQMLKKLEAVDDDVEIIWWRGKDSDVRGFLRPE